MYNVYENVIVTQFKHDKVLNRKFFTLFHYKKNIKSSIEIVLLFYHNCNITILVSQIQTNYPVIFYNVNLDFKKRIQEKL